MRKLLNITKDKLRSSSRSRSSASNATPTLPSVNISAQSSNLVSAPAPVPPLPAVAATKPDRTGRNIAVFRTVLSVVEKALDGLPIYGPKAVVTAVGEVLKNIQLKLDNDASIRDIENIGHELSSRLESTSKDSGSMTNTSPDLKKRVDELRMEIESHLSVLGQYTVIEPVQPNTSVVVTIKKWLRQTEETLSAEAIAKALPEVNQKIVLSLQKFMVDVQIRIAVEVGIIRADQITQDDRNLLDRLSPIKAAFYNDAKAAGGCLPGTRVALLETVAGWIGDDSPDSPLVMWLSGNAGTGKTTIAQSVCELVGDRFGAAFFFSRDEASRRHPTNVIPTIVYQLAYNRPALQRHICDAIKSDPDVSSKALQPQADKLITDALSKGSKSQPTLLLVLDALDECNKENGQEGGSLIPLLFGRLRVLPFRVKVFITSRPEASIQKIFKNLTGHIRPFVLHDIEEHVVQNDIERYLRCAFMEISSNFLDGKPWPEEEVIKALITQAGKLFIYAATVAKYVSGDFPERRLRRFLSAHARELKSSHSALDQVYTQIITAVIATSDEEDVGYLTDIFKHVVGAIVILQQPLSRAALSKLIDKPLEEVNVVLRPLYSLLDIGDLSYGKAPIRIFHPSFPDFITSPDRCLDARLRVDRAEIHPLLLSGCFSVMEAQLRQDICRIGDPGLLNSEVPDFDHRLDEHISEELRYACTYWMTHLVEMADLPTEVFRQLMRFCETHLLHWIECLSLLRSLRSAAEGLPRALAWLAQSSPPTHCDDEKEYALVTALLNDALRVIREYWIPITASALHVYHTALVFMPDCELHRVEKAKTTGVAQLVLARHGGWDSCLQVLEGHARPVLAVAFSPNNQHIASVSTDETMRIWESATGEMSIIFGCEPNDHPLTVTYSVDGSRIFSGTRYGGIQALSVPDTTSTWVVAPQNRSGFEAVISMAVCPDGSRLAFTRQSERKVYMCDPRSGELTTFICDGNNAISENNHLEGAGDENSDLHDLNLGAKSESDDNEDSDSDDLNLWAGSESDEKYTTGAKEKFLAVTFTQVKSGLCVVSASSEGKVYRWDIEQKGPPTVLSNERFEATKAAFSVNGSCVVLGSKNGDIQIRDHTQLSRAPVLLHGHRSFISAVCFSSDGSRVASGSEDYTLRIWNAVTGDCLAVIEGYGNITTSVVFSSDGLRLASGSDDSTIRIWNATTRGNTRQTIGHTEKVSSVAFSADGSRVASGSHDRTIRLWDTNTGKLIATSMVNEDAILSVISLLSGSDIVFGDLRGRVRIWNVDTGEVNLLFEQIGDKIVTVLASSPDGSLIAAVDAFGYIKIFSRITKAVKVVFEFSMYIKCAAFSADNARLVLGAYNGKICIWDILGAQAIQTLTLSLTAIIFSVAFSSDGLRIITTSATGVRSYSASTGKLTPADQAGDTDAELRNQSAFWCDDTTGWLNYTRADIPLPVRLCWLPVSNRHSALSWSRTKVVIGAQSGLVLVLDFSSHPLFQLRPALGL